MSTVGEVMSQDVLTVERHTTLGSVARALQGRNVGSAIVVDDGAAIGIITERDLVSAVAASRPADVAEAGSWMTEELVTVDRDTPLERAHALMLERHIRHLPVLDGTRPVGMVSIRDVAR